MSWAALPPTIQRIAETVLTPRQLQAWQLELQGHGTRRISLQLGISRSAVIDRLESAHRNLIAAGIRQNPSGEWHQEAA